jgi:ribosomal protein S27AE
MPKYVHGNKQWFSIGHTFGNGHPPKPFAKNTDLCGFLFRFPYKELPPTFCELKIGRKPVYFLQILPIYKEEMEYIIQNGSVEFDKRLLEKKIPEYLELQRVNVFAGRKDMVDSEGTFCRNCGTVVRNIGSNKKRVKCKQCGETIQLK